jgi:hypothetical protein
MAIGGHLRLVGDFDQATTAFIDYADTPGPGTDMTWRWRWRLRAAVGVKAHITAGCPAMYDCFPQSG